MRIFTGLTIVTLCAGLVLGGCGGKKSASGKSSSQQSQSSTSKGSSKGAKSGGKSAADKTKSSSSSKSSSTTKSSKSGSSSSGESASGKAPPTTGTTTQTGNPTGSNIQAAALFQQKCQVCHGAGGKGGSGPKLDAGLTTRFQTQAALQSFIQKNMPFSSPGSLTQAQSGALARYLWSMQKP